VKARDAAARGGFVSAACVACCAPPIIAAVGVTAGLALVAAVFVGLAIAVAVVLLGGARIISRRTSGARRSCGRGVASSATSP
jgi:hypothetical protein